MADRGEGSPRADDDPGRVDFRAPLVWPSPELVDRFVPATDFHFRLGEDTPLPADDPEALGRARRFRDVLGLFATGVTVVTSMSDGEPVGLTCQSFSSVSLDPPLVLFCPARTSRAWPLMERAGFFCVNVLSTAQAALSDVMATKGDAKFDGVGWSPAKSGAPLLDGATAYVDCSVEAVHEAGDHHVVLGRVQDLGRGEAPAAPDPLIFYRGRYTRLADGP